MSSYYKLIFSTVVCGLSLLSVVSAQTSTGPNIWSLSPQERQALLAEQQRQAQLAQTQSMQIQQQIRDAYASQQQAQMNLRQSQLDYVESQQQSVQSKQAATNAAMEAGRASVAGDLAKERMSKQTDLVVKAANGWQPPKGYSTSGAPKATLADPFAPKPQQAQESPEQSLKRAVEGSCLTLDEEHGVARTTVSCNWQGLTRELQANVYPVLPDGSLLDSAARVQRFLQSVRDSSDKICVMRPEGELVWIR